MAKENIGLWLLKIMPKKNKNTDGNIKYIIGAKIGVKFSDNTLKSQYFQGFQNFEYKRVRLEGCTSCSAVQ